MLAVSHRSSEALPTLHRGVMEESGTINPAALNAPGKHFLHRSLPCDASLAATAHHAAAASRCHTQARTASVASADTPSCHIASTIAPNLLSQPSPRGIKRSRSPSANSGIGQDPIGGMYLCKMWIYIGLEILVAT